MEDLRTRCEKERPRLSETGDHRASQNPPINVSLSILCPRARVALSRCTKILGIYTEYTWKSKCQSFGEIHGRNVSSFMLSLLLCHQYPCHFSLLPTLLQSSLSPTGDGAKWAGPSIESLGQQMAGG